MPQLFGPTSGTDNCRKYIKIQFNRLCIEAIFVIIVFRRNYRKLGAKKRGYSFNLNFSQVESLIFLNCAYCGVEPSNLCKTQAGELQYSGIDRIDNNQGYFIENCIPCCADCNYSKGALTLEEYWDLRIRLVRSFDSFKEWALPIIKENADKMPFRKLIKGKHKREWVSISLENFKDELGII